MHLNAVLVLGDYAYYELAFFQLCFNGVYLIVQGVKAISSTFLNKKMHILHPCKTKQPYRLYVGGKRKEITPHE